MTIAARLNDARRQLVEHLALSPAEAAIEAQMLLRAALGDVSRAWLIAHDTQHLSEAEAQAFSRHLQRRLAGEPVAYILGRREFYGLELQITPDVLIPRPDTEILVEAALLRIPADATCRVLDLGTGSGAIALAIAIQRPMATVLAVERADAAVRVARANAARLGACNVEVIQSDWFQGLNDNPFDIIVSNPPYIALDDPHLAHGDLRFEPLQALAAGPDGLEDLRYIVHKAPAHLSCGGWLLLEHGYDQASAVAALMHEAEFTQIDHATDLAGIKRVTYGQRV